MALLVLEVPIRFRLLIAAATAALTLAPLSSGATARQLHSREHRQVRSLHRHVGTLRFFRSHPRLARTAAGRRALRVARVWLPIVRRELAETRAQLRPRLGLPSSWIAAALCVHSGWHYSTARQHGRPEYVIDGVGYWRTWDVPDLIYGGSGEGGWDAANGGYGGGMQMDGAFQSNYGAAYLTRYGPAGKWPVAVQLLVAYRGWLRQGWGAWPNTSRACGLR